MLKTLLKKQLAEIFRQYLYDAKKNKKRSATAVVMLFVLYAFLMVVVLGGMFSLLALALCGICVSTQMEWLYFTLLSILAVLLGCFGSVFSTYSGLYLSKDNDFLLSMPIPVHYIMVSRLLSVYLMGLLYAGVVLLPAVIVYWLMVPLTVGRVIGPLLLLLLISLLVMVLSCVLGYVVARISLKLKNKSFVTVLISLLFFGAYYVVCFRAQSLIENLLEHLSEYGEALRGAAYPLYLLGRVGEGNGFAMAVVSAVILAVFALMWWVLSRSFLKIATAGGKTETVRYREKKACRRSVSQALFFKELRRFCTSPTYMLNCGIGSVFLVIAGVLVLVKGPEMMALLRTEMPMAGDFWAALAAAVVCLIVSMNVVTAPSVSLEGKSLWLLHSLPVSPWQALRAKLCLALLLNEIPVLFCSVCAASVLAKNVWEGVMVVLLPLLFTALSACFGLMLGVKMANLTWTNETAPIKQSAPVALTLFGGWIYAIAAGAGYFLLGVLIGTVGYLILVSVVTATLAGLSLAWLKTGGVRALTAL